MSTGPEELSTDDTNLAMNTLDGCSFFELPMQQSQRVQPQTEATSHVSCAAGVLPIRRRSTINTDLSHIGEPDFDGAMPSNANATPLQLAGDVLRCTSFTAKLLAGAAFDLLRSKVTK